MTASGCPDPECDAAWAKIDTTPSSQTILACTTGLACKDLCGDLKDQSGAFQKTCIAPMKRAAAAEAAADDAHHRRMMGLIGSINARTTRVVGPSGEYSTRIERSPRRPDRARPREDEGAGHEV